MYQMSQGYMGSTNCCGYSGGGSHLEYLAQSEGNYASSESNVSYSISSGSNNQSYSFVSSSSSLSTSASLGVGYHSGGSSSSGYHSPEAVYQFLKVQPEYHFQPNEFLNPGKEGMFVGKAEEIRPFVEEAFEKIFSQSFPQEIKISLCDEEQFRKLALHPGTIGLSINRCRQGLLSEIFVLNDALGRVMLTIGHELGHVLTETLENKHDEEAKAYAFSLAWMKVIKENNIAGLQEAIVTERPAENGLHNLAFFFVEKLVRLGEGAWEVYQKLVKRMISVVPELFLQLS